MMANLFSIFDPASVMNMSLNWSSILIGLAILPPSFFLFNSRTLSAWGTLISYLNKEVSTLLPTKVHHFMVIFLALFMFIMFNNSLGLLPHIFTASSHLVFTMSLALPIWLGYYMYGWVNKFKGMMAHLVPSGTPAPLIPFMVVIETVSSLIRPLTLAVRLAANMIAGHLLMALLSNYATIFAPTMFVVVAGGQVLLLTLETAVAVIQAYVFMVLSVLYVSEI
uniref:ATP synthase subunit a n=1 Tax=Proasellus cavaticus TaxID=1281949 RepID=A0A485M7H5_9CRUS|nr:ATP synthase 6 [Proasellus cavaticus]